MKYKYKRHLIEGNYYTVRQLAIKLGISHYRVKAKILEGASTLEGIKSKIFLKEAPNYRHSMYVDRHGHWRLLAKALKC